MRQWQTDFWSLCHMNIRMHPAASWNRPDDMDIKVKGSRQMMWPRWGPAEHGYSCIPLSEPSIDATTMCICTD